MPSGIKKTTKASKGRRSTKVMGESQQRTSRCRLMNPTSIEITTQQAVGVFQIKTGTIEIEGYNGVLIDFNRRGNHAECVVCTMPRGDGELCGSIITNGGKNLRSHLSDIHKDGSKYQKKHNKERWFRCRNPDHVVKGMNAFIAHCQRCWDHKGTYEALLKHELPEEYSRSRE